MREVYANANKSIAIDSLVCKAYLYNISISKVGKMKQTILKKSRQVRLGLVFAAVILTAGTLLITANNPVRAAACAAPPANYGSATATVTIPSTADYRIWSRIMPADSTNNSYLLEVDGAHCFSVGGGSLQPNAWAWVDYQGGATSSKITLPLTTGTHAVKIIGSQPGVKFDRVIFTSDPNCTPTGNGDNCNAPTDTTQPTVGLTAPADNATLSGKVMVTANASDNSGIREVQFYANSTKLGADTTAPYALEWDTTKFADGAVTVIAKAYDTAGNSSSASHEVTVQNQLSDTQPPSQPTNVTATAMAYNKVTVNWQASTDNVSVTGYKLTRDGTQLATLGASATSYQDSSLLPSTTYRYKVVALDAAGNTSAPSTEVSVTTPSVPDSEPPTAPRGLTASAVNSKQINLTWQPSEDNVSVKDYEVFRSSGGEARKVATVTTTSFGDAGLRAAVEYSYYIKARDAAGNVSDVSEIAKAKTQGKKRSATVRGEVHGIRGTHLRGANVEIAVEGIKYTATTNKNGRYVIRHIPRGKYTLTFSASGYQTKSLSRQISDALVWQEVTLRKK